jgi:hypothetical protein
MDNNIKKYYENVDDTIINKYLNNNKYKNLLELSRKNDIPIFNKGKKKWKIKNKKQMINDCKVKKKKKIKNLSKMIKDLAKEPNFEILTKIKIINKEFENEIINIDSMIEEIQISSKKKTESDDEFIEVYKN